MGLFTEDVAGKTHVDDLPLPEESTTSSAVDISECDLCAAVKGWVFKMCCAVAEPTLWRALALANRKIYIRAHAATFAADGWRAYSFRYQQPDFHGHRCDLRHANWANSGKTLIVGG